MNHQKHTGYVDGMHRYIYPDTHLHNHEYRWNSHEFPPRLKRSYLWRVTDHSPECLTLTSVGVPDEQVHLTHEDCKYVLAYEPSWYLKLGDHPEEWAWFRAAGWDIYATDWVPETRGLDAEYFEDDDVRLPREPHIYVSAHRHDGKGYHDGAHLSIEQAGTHEGAQRFLREMLYCHVHPKKAEGYTTGVHPEPRYLNIPAEEMAKFVARLRREDVKRTPPTTRPAKRKRPD